MAHKIANDRLALVGVQEGYRDVLKIQLEEEQEQHEATKVKVEQLTQACLDMKEEIRALRSEKERLQEKADNHDAAVAASAQAAKELQKIKEETYKKLMSAAKTTEQAQERAAHADRYESGMATQIAALQERLTATQLSTAKDRAALEKTIRHLTNTISQNDATVADLHSQLDASKATFQIEKENSVFSALQQVEPYKQLNSKLMEELSSLREEHLHTSEMCEKLTHQSEDLIVENNRLKEAQRMLTAGYLNKREEREAPDIGVDSVSRMLSIEEDAFTSPSDDCIRELDRDMPPESNKKNEPEYQVEHLLREQHHLQQVQEQHSQQLEFLIHSQIPVKAAPSQPPPPPPPPPPVVVVPEPTPEQVEVLQTLRSSLAEVRGLLSKRNTAKNTPPSPPVAAT